MLLWLPPPSPSSPQEGYGDQTARQTTRFRLGIQRTAFVGAELLWQEYKDQSIWYGVAGYAVATGTGFFRMYNNKHWLSDVAMGAGIGILSTKIAYWLLPLFDRTLGAQNSNYVVLPSYNGKQFCLSAHLRF